MTDLEKLVEEKGLNKKAYTCGHLINKVNNL